ncbi:MAG: hypothetical protein KDC71_24770, partial [Acidobacteria bacterium]|nr:hypothetical protein [Acidobacteriota bacterium]
MTQIDQFESVFKAAARTPFEDLKRPWKHWLFISDRDADFTQRLGDQTAHFLSIVCHQRSTLTQADYQALGDLLEKVNTLNPDLILTYRNLKTDNWKWPYSLGSYLDVLTQATTIPVLVLPHPDPSGQLSFPETDCRDVMAVTNHLTGDNALVSAALDFTPAQGQLW